MPLSSFIRERALCHQSFKARRFFLAEIGRRLGRHYTTISREITRNRPTYADDAIYWYYTHPKAVERHHKARHHRRRNHGRLFAYVTAKIRLDWSPEAIAARVKLEYPDDDTMRISHETIYRWIYLDSRNKGNLHHHLRRRHKYRRRQKRYGSGRRFIPGRISIDQRPSIVNTRERCGDWEGDTLEWGLRGRSLHPYLLDLSISSICSLSGAILFLTTSHTRS
jgi:IS30 family transposase